MLLDNPFHILGLPADCSAKELTQRESRIRAYVEVGKPLLFEEDLLFPKCKRNSGATKVASTMLQDSGQRLKAGLFWFTRTGLIDDAGFDTLREKGLVPALLHWHKVADREQITARYISSVSNYATLCILLPLVLSWDDMKEGATSIGFKTRQQLVYRGLALKATLLGNAPEEVLRGHLVAVSDEMTGSDIQRAVDQFGLAVKELVDECRKYGVTLAMSQVAKSLGKGGARCADLMQPFVNEHRQDLEEALAECASARSSDRSQALRVVKMLLARAKSSLKELKRISGSDDLVYQSFVDRVAEEVLQGCIDAFNHAIDNDTESVKLVEEIEGIMGKIAELEVGPRVAERLRENKRVILDQKEGIRKNALMPKSLNSWMKSALQKMEVGVVSGQGSSMVDFVSASLESGYSHGSRSSVLRALNEYRSNAAGAGVSGFEISDDFRQSASMVCHICVGMMVNAANDGYMDKNEVMRKSLPLFSILESKFSTSRTSIAEGTFPIDEKAYQRIISNKRILSNNLGGGSNGGSGCMVAAAFLFAVFGLTLFSLT